VTEASAAPRPRVSTGGQAAWTLRCDWGPAGAAAVAEGSAFVVVVDVLSFTTTLSIAVDAGAEVFPYPWGDASAREFADEHRALLAVGRFEARTVPGAPAPAATLSPAGMQHEAARLAGTRIVLPSPNGSAVSVALGSSSATVVGASLRNRRAVARWIVGELVRAAPGEAVDETAVSGPAVALVAAGERWPDGSLRPAVEDLWGAGAVLEALLEEAEVHGLGGLSASPEARAALAAWFSARPDDGGPDGAGTVSELEDVLLTSDSGRELADRGFAADVGVAAELDVSVAVPVLRGERFVGVRT
jgi:2-phosphosulfolactate phosphatase